MYDSKLKDFVKIGLHNQARGRSGYTTYGKLLIDTMSKFNVYLPQKCELSEFRYWIMQDILERPKCPKCGCDLVNYSVSCGVLTYQQYCNGTCYHSDEIKNKELSGIKKKLYSDESWKTKTESKKIATLNKNYGVDHPMQSEEIFEKQQKSCFKNGKNIDGMFMIGYEPYVYENHLRGNYQTIMQGTKFLKANNIKIQWLDNEGKLHNSYPDFVVINDEHETFFVEIKSAYTREKHDYKIMKTKDAILKLGFNYIILTSTPKQKLIEECFIA